ncbi:hypothetical protein [Cellulomonas rhizosphaerae]|uniref:Uncharacterized protein n=1 Tax=Cellulomonas rhizosphaerae TaxID=2293719 RepID=A0A413RLL3_9CELL|nr:hypothetical protein [Cellulomonas rhizosphaerae]RHA40746.1 hypothetical protein D1825_09625 [Cellulomonas rhizosphaerae]
MTINEISALPDEQLYRIPGGAKLHIRGCRHLSGAKPGAATLATRPEINRIPVCSSCQSNLGGEGRTAYAEFDEALEAFHAPVANRPRMREIFASVEHARIWIPYSGTYIAVAPEEGQVAAFFNKGFVDVHAAGGGYETETLPHTTTAPSKTTATKAVALEAPPQLCPGCWTVLPSSGQCDGCAL